MSSVLKNTKKIFTGTSNSGGGDPSLPGRVTTLEDNEYKITYYEIISGTSGSLTLPTGATINAGEFGLSGNAILSKIDGSNKPTFESPKTAGGTVVTASLNETTGAWVASGVYTDPSVALIYSIKIKAIDYHNLTYDNIIETINIDNSLNNKGDDYFLKIGATTFDSRYSTNATAFGITTQAIGKDAMVAIPFIIEETMTFDRIGAEVTSPVASGVCSLLIYDSVNNVPTNLVLDAGTISVASATYQEITINKQLTAGLYFLVFWHNGSATPTFRAMPTAACNKVLGLPSTLGTGNTYTRIFNSKVYTTAPLTYDLTGFTVFGGNNPIISLRRSA